MADLSEFFWGGYLTFLVNQGAVTTETPREEVEQIKGEFKAGLRGERCKCTVTPVADIGENE